jgi:FKBP-type peptidyl-prolyl cis-trans isomerase
VKQKINWGQKGFDLSKKQRAAWLFLTALFIFTGVGLGVWAFWVDTHPQTPPTASQTNQTKDNNVPKLEGTKLQNFTPVASVDSLQKTDTTVGAGKEATASSTVTAHYTGAVAATGVIFQSSLDTGKPATFPLSNVIKGWQEGVPGMKVGGTRRLLIPASMAYGATPPAGSGIPANADLVFDITLVDVK